MHVQEQQMRGRGFLTAREVSELLGLHIASVYRMAKAGHVVYQRIGRSWYIDLDSLSKWLRRAGPEHAPIALLAKLDQLRKATVHQAVV
jgi:excisionase family DNA binding protein